MWQANRIKERGKGITMKKFVCLVFVLGLVAALPGVSHATNGMNMIGIGAVSSGMGGADTAVPSGCAAVASNPANLATTCSQVVSVGTSILMPSMSVTMPGASEVDNESQMFFLPFLGYAQRLGDTPWALGIGVFAQGGMGVDFRGVRNFMGAADSLYSQIAFLRVAPTVSYNVNERFRIGATAFLGYATMDYEFFPNMMQGQDVSGLSSYTFAGRIGATYDINDQWSVGLTYTSESALDFEDGTMKLNMGPGMGVVTYNDVSMDNFTWPQQVEAGVSWRPAEKWLLAFDVSWVNWASAIEKVTVRATNPNMPLPAGYNTISVPFEMNWDDQFVFALGAQYEINDMWTVRAGYNYGKNPVPDDTLNPLFPAIVEHHLTAGFSWKYGNWDFDFAYEHAFSNDQTNTGAATALNPFSGTEVSHYQNSLHFMLSYRF